MEPRKHLLEPLRPRHVKRHGLRTTTSGSTSSSIIFEMISGSLMFIRSMRRLNVALFLSDLVLASYFASHLGNQRLIEIDRRLSRRTYQRSTPRCLRRARPCLVTGREPLSTITSDGPCVAETTVSRDAAPICR